MWSVQLLVSGVRSVLFGVLCVVCVARSDVRYMVSSVAGVWCVLCEDGVCCVRMVCGSGVWGVVCGV